MCCKAVREALQEKALSNEVAMADGRRMMSLAFGLLAHCPDEVARVVDGGGAHAQRLLGQVRQAEEQSSDFARRVAETAKENLMRELNEAGIWLGSDELVREAKEKIERS